MNSNFLALLLVIGLAVLGGWLTYRAVKAQRLVVKIAGGLSAGLLSLLFVAIAFVSGKGLAGIYFPDAPPAPDLQIAGTPEQIARGAYLVNLSCVGCHSAVGADANPSGEHPLSGGWNFSAAEGFGFAGDMIAENLTPGGKLASYSDGELFRVLRHGINQEGNLLLFMPLLPYAQLSDADTESIIAYLRTLPPTPSNGPTGDRLTFVGALFYGAGIFGTPDPGAISVSAPPPGVTAEYGKYVATFGECRGCHGPEAAGVAATSMFPAVPNPRPLVSSLTPEQFAEMMRTGVKPDGIPFPKSMPFQVAAGMTDDDLAALYAYLVAPIE